jgi:hypothetical protein
VVDVLHWIDDMIRTRHSRDAVPIRQAGSQSSDRETLRVDGNSWGSHDGRDDRLARRQDAGSRDRSLTGHGRRGRAGNGLSVDVDLVTEQVGSCYKSREEKSGRPGRHGERDLTRVKWLLVGWNILFLLLSLSLIWSDERKKDHSASSDENRGCAFVDGKRTCKTYKH